ncbi:MAG: ABC transporter ATP-binding protein/permease [Chloroflexi bacterium]|nr:ABC transporter ATP-binding protein/permease [Chloroflexota bacterium]
MFTRIAHTWHFSRRAWKLAAPYWSSEERWAARALLALVTALTLGLVFLNVLLNDWNREFFEAIQNKDFASFGPLLLRFSVLAAIFIVGAVFRLYFTQMLQMRWRIWLTRHFLDRWFDGHAYYQLEVGQARADNPDQRIAEDLRMFAFNTLTLVFGLLGSVVTLVSFIGILWVISGPIALSLGDVSLEIPGYMVWVAILYAIVGSVLTHFVGRPLIRLNFQQQRVEADLRFGLVRLRENSEGVALYGGEGTERRDLDSRVDRIRANWWQLMRYTKNLTFLTTGYDQMADIFPILVAAPRYFTGAISLGVLTQIGNAFGQVQGALSWFVESYGSLADWKATVDRLLTFQDTMEAARVQATQHAGISVVANGHAAVSAEKLELALPDGRVVVPDLSLTVEPGERVLISGPTGVGKSTLFRALAGIWPFGRGEVHVPRDAHLLFLPQRPYLPIASLRDVALYPASSASAKIDDAAIRETLEAVGLGAFADRLDAEDNWSLQMSGGEQQRLAIARAILQRPDWLFLDEATAALDDDSEQQLYTLLKCRLPETAIVSIAHRKGVADFHTRHITLDRATVDAPELPAMAA